MTMGGNPPLGVPDDGGSGEPYDTGKDEKTFEALDKGELKPSGGDDKSGEDEKPEPGKVLSVDEMMEGEKPKDDLVEEEDLDEDLDEDDEDKGEEKDDEKEEEEQDTEREPGEEDTLHTRPSYPAVKKAFPDLFKKFPEIRSMLFREPEFSKLFPTVREAKETAEYADNARALEQMIMTGDSTELLKGIQGSSPQVLEKFIQGLPSAIYSLSQEGYVKMTTPIIRNAFVIARQHARSHGDKDLWNGLDHIERYLFGDPRFSLKKEKATEDPLKEERARLDAERAEHQNRVYHGFEMDVKNRSQKLLVKEFIRGLDPQNAISPRMRNILAQQALEEIGARMERDTAHISAMNNLWRKAISSRLSEESKEQLIRAWLSRARPLVGAVRRKLLAEVLGRGETKEKKENPPRVPSGRERGNARAPLSGVSPAKVDYSKTSDDDILSGKVTLRK